jgi:hypothetical protein
MERARAIVPPGYLLAYEAPRHVPMVRFTWETLSRFLGIPELAGFVLAAGPRTQCWIDGVSWLPSPVTFAGRVGVYWCARGDHIGFSAEGRGSGPNSTAQLLPFVKDASYVRPEVDLSQPWPPLPGLLKGDPMDMFD